MGDRVCVIDDDAASREALQRLFRSVGVDHATFDTAEAFLQQLPSHGCGCIVADIRLRGMSGLELMEVLKKNKLMIPVVIVSGFATMRTAVRAMRMGALSVLSKPVDEEELWSTVREGLSQYAIASQRQNRRKELQQSFASLTPQEQTVADAVIDGCTNKVIAEQLSVSVRTVEARRHNVLHKTGAQSIPELVKLWLASKDPEEMLDILYSRPPGNIDPQAWEFGDRAAG